MNWWQHIFNPKLPQKGNTREERSAEEALISAEALRQLNRLHLNAGRFLAGQSMGSRTSQRRMPAYDFREHRLYTPGDDVRFVDWKVSARQEHVFIRQGELPKEATIYIILDCSASMGWGKPPKLIAAQSSCAVLGFSALNHGDRLFLHTFSSTEANSNGGERQTKSYGPLSGKGQVPGFLKRLFELNCSGETDLYETITRLKRQAVVGGMAIIISDLLDCLRDDNEKFIQSLDLLPAPTWDVVVMHLLHPEERSPSLRGEFELRDVETLQTRNYDLTKKNVEEYQARFEGWCKSLEMACVEANAFYLLIDSSWDVSRQIIPRLRDLNILVPS